MLHMAWCSSCRGRRSRACTRGSRGSVHRRVRALDARFLGRPLVELHLRTSHGSRVLLLLTCTRVDGPSPGAPPLCFCVGREVEPQLLALRSRDALSSAESASSGFELFSAT